MPFYKDYLKTNINSLISMQQLQQTIDDLKQ